MHLSCRLVPLDELTIGQVEQWRRLSSTSLEKNAYLCPEFVLPSVDVAESRLSPLVLIAAADETDEADIHGLGIFEAAPPTAKFWMPYLRAYKSPYSFLTGLLIREDMGGEVATEMMRYLVFGPHRWAAVHFADMPRNGRQAEVLREACRRLDVEWHLDYRSQRAALDLREGRRDRWREHVSRSRIKDLLRCRSKLEALGTLEWRYVGELVGEEQVEAYLHLEHLGWKAEVGTSLRSQTSDENFFRRLVMGFAEGGGVFFTELLLDGEVIASICTLCVGDEGFGFKTAFDPRYAKMAPGLINEYEFLLALERVPRLTDLDSGAVEGSYIDKLWPERRPLGTGYYVGRRSAKVVAAVVDVLRRVRRRVLRCLRRKPPAPWP